MSQQGLESRLDALLSDRVAYFPIRHHSPVCARFLERLLRLWKPVAVLVEGPASFTPLIPQLLDPATHPPVAVYVSCPREEPTEAPGGERTPAFPGVARHAAYYPFCETSPEWVALRVGSELNARLRFIDLDFAAQKNVESAVECGPPRVESLLDERHLQRSRYLRELARRCGCRDHNDLWEHLFETRIGEAADAELETVRRFMRDVGAWCHFARVDSEEEALERDGTLAREAAMVGAIRQELEVGEGRVVVVTGGFHSVVLPGGVEGTPPDVGGYGKSAEGKEEGVLVRYGFEALDALNGYSAGMVSPWYWNELWRASGRLPGAEAAREVAARVLVELGRTTRQERWLTSLSTADGIAALEQACRMAQLRNHPGPTREDLMDGIRSCLVKGAMDAEGQAVLGLALRIMGGTGLGEVCPGAGVVPLVQDARSTAESLRLSTTDSKVRELELDLYRKVRHRKLSRYLHSLAFLGVALGELKAGPDFVTGQNLDRLFEHWTCVWTPLVEGALVEAGIHGATVEEATVNRWLLSVAGLEAKGRGRDATEAVALLIHACRMGLHRHAAQCAVAISERLAEDPSVVSVASALRQLVLLWESREPLEAQAVPEIPVLIGAACQRACQLLGTLADTAEDSAGEVLEALMELRMLTSGGMGQRVGLDPELFLGLLESARTHPGCPPLLLGGIVGILHGAERLTEAELMRMLSGALGAVAVDPGDQTAFLTGLLRTARELAWQLPGLAESVDRLFAGWTDDEFLDRLPHLRLAFAGLTPRETDRVAKVVSGLHGDAVLRWQDAGSLNAEDAVAFARMESELARVMAADGLGDWVSGEVRA